MEKKYILAHRFGDMGEYFVRVNPEGWDEIYSPVFATRFATKKEATSWSKENTTYGEYAVACSAQKEIEKYEKFLAEGTIRRSFELLDKTVSRKYNNESPEEILKWWISYKGDDHVRHEDYMTWPDIYTCFKYLHVVELWNSKDYKEKYLSFQMKVSPDGNLEDFKKELNLVVEDITRLDEDGNKVISIFDHYLCEGGDSVNFLIRPNGTYAIEGRYTHKVSGTLEEVFKYWKAERYYD